MREEDRALLEELLLARGPGGQEDEVRAICQRELEGCCDEVGSRPSSRVTRPISQGGIAARPGRLPMIRKSRQRSSTWR